VVDGVLLAMTAWLFAKGEGATGVLCLSIGISVLLMTRRTGLRPWALSIGRNLWVAVILIVPAVLANTGWFLNVVGNLFGRSETLLGRLDLWQVIGPLNGNPLLGVGYGSFWIGPRLQSLWNTYWWQPTQAHNGYVETYLTLGYVGLGLLIVTILTACRKATATTLRVELAALKLGFLLPIVLFNVTEAAFKGVHLIWFIFLLFAVETATEMQRKPAGNGLASAGPRVLAKRERLINGYEKPWPQVLKHFRDSRTGAAGRAEEALVRRETFGK
jgi:O-antigen ligase